jgi:hypothetical protein
MQHLVLNVKTALLAAAVGLAAAEAMADGTYQFTIDGTLSSLNSSVEVTAPTEGTLIGDFDAVANPTGTRTKPGVFGTFGETENVPVPLMIGLVIEGQNTTNPTGGFALQLDLDAGTATLSGLSIDLLGEVVPAIDMTANIRWDTFRTRNPTCLVIGGFNIPLPLGEATITTFTVDQGEGEAEGALIPAGPGTYTVAIPVTVELSLGAAVLDQELPPTPQSLPLVFAATVTLDGQGGASISVGLDGFEILQELEDPIGDPFQLPFTEPLCQGNLIFTLQLLGLSIASSSDATLVATGTKQAAPACPCDWDGSGAIGVPDIFAFLASWFGQEPAADFDGVGGIAVPDIFAFLACWFGRPGSCV